MNFKKAVISTIGLAAISLTLPFNALAVDPTLITTVSGVVKNGSNTPESGVHVDVTCNAHTKSATTEADGTYGVAFDTADNCVSGSTVAVTGTKGSASGGGSGTVHNAFNSPSLVVNFAVVNFSVPEFSTILGLITGMGSLGGFFAFRKKFA